MSSADVAVTAVPVWRDWLQLARISNTPTVVSNSVAGAALVARLAGRRHGRGRRARDGALLHGGDGPQRRHGSRDRPARAPRAAAAVGPDLARRGARVGRRAVRGRRGAARRGGLGAGGRRARADRADRPLRRLAQGQRRLAGADGRLPRARLRRRRLRHRRVAPVGAVGRRRRCCCSTSSASRRSPRPRRPGARRAWPTAAVLAPVVFWAFLLPPLGFILLAAFAAWVLWALRLVRSKRIGPAVGAMIAGVALFDAVAVASADGSARRRSPCAWPPSLSRSLCRPRSKEPDA